MQYPWEETKPAIREAKITRPASTWSVTLLVAVSFLLGSYFPWQPYDFSKFGDKQSEVVSIEKGSWVLVVEETEDRSKFPWLATVQADADFWAGLKSQGINWQFYDVDSDSIVAYKPDALAAGLPALLVVSPVGAVRVAKSCPPTTTAIAEVLGGVR